MNWIAKIQHPSIRNADEIAKFKYNILFLLVSSILLIISFFLPKYIWEYKEIFSFFNESLIILYVLLIFSLYLLRFKGMVKLAAILSLSISSCITYFMILMVGGFNAPGYYWIGIVPLLFGFILNYRWSILAGLISCLAASSFIYFESIGINFNIMPSEEIFEGQKKVNFYLFLLFSTGLAYISAYLGEKSHRTIVNQRRDVEDLLRILVHDVSNPLNVALLRLGRLHKKHQITDEEFQGIFKSLDSISNITSSVKDMMRNQLQADKISLEEVDLVKVLTNSISILQEIASDKNITINFVKDIEQALILAERHSLEVQVFNNILSNAIKFSYENSIIEVSLKAHNNSYVVIIKDSGVGIAESKLVDLFELKSGKSTLGVSGEVGSGFGLTIVRKFIDLFKGEVQVRSQVGDDHGTEFKFIFPGL